MPLRPRQHEIGGQAAAAVANVWGAAGYANEVVKNDYGDDLLVQLHSRVTALMDPARIWIQVKGVDGSQSSAAAARARNVRLGSSVVNRWALTADLFVLVVWDVNQNTGWYALPQHIDPTVLENTSKTMTIRVDEADHFGLSAVPGIVMSAHLHHAEGLLGRLLLRQRVLKDFPEDAVKAQNAQYLTWARCRAIVDVLAKLECIDPVERITDGFRATDRFTDALAVQAQRQLAAEGQWPGDAEDVLAQIYVDAVVSLLPRPVLLPMTVLQEIGTFLRAAHQLISRRDDR
jgi:hypothetical protein